MDAEVHPLTSITQAHNVISTMWQGFIKPGLVEGKRLVLVIKPATRSTEQNAKFHAMLGEIAKQIEWAGAKRSLDVWKRLLVAAWLRARGEHVEVLPALDGKGVDIVFEQTSKLSVPLMAELIEFVYAWGAQAGVEFTQ